VRDALPCRQGYTPGMLKPLPLFLAMLALLSPILGALPARTAEEAWGALSLLDQSVAPGEKQRIRFETESNWIGATLDTLVLVARGREAGPTLCLVAAVHGDELNGVEIARREFAAFDVAETSGTLIALPMVNIHGVRSSTRYLPDRRDLNRAFPGNPRGSTASIVAAAVFGEVLNPHCDRIVDLHTGSANRRNLPQIRADLDVPSVRELAEGFGSGVVIHGAGPEKSLRREAVDAGIPAVIYEAGGPLRFEREEIEQGVAGVQRVMRRLGMIAKAPASPSEQRSFRKTRWVRTRTGGIFLTDLPLGSEVAAGQVMGTVTDPFTDQREEIRAPVAGFLIGGAEPQVVMAGYALFHLGIE